MLRYRIEENKSSRNDKQIHTTTQHSSFLCSVQHWSAAVTLPVYEGVNLVASSRSRLGHVTTLYVLLVNNSVTFSARVPACQSVSACHTCHTENDQEVQIQGTSH